MLPHLCLTFWGFIYRTILLLCFVSSLFSSTLGFRRSSSNGFQTREFHQFLKQGSGAVRITSYWTSKNGKEWSSAFFFPPDGFTLIPIIVHLIAVQFISGFKNEERFQCYTNFSRLNFSPIWKMVMKICRCPKSVGDIKQTLEIRVK